MHKFLRHQSPRSSAPLRVCKLSLFLFSSIIYGHQHVIYTWQSQTSLIHLDPLLSYAESFSLLHCRSSVASACKSAPVSGRRVVCCCWFGLLACPALHPSSLSFCSLGPLSLGGESGSPGRRLG